MDPQSGRQWKKRARNKARKQHWVIRRDQLLSLGAKPDAIKHRVRSGRFHPLFRGVYSVGRPDPGRLGWFMAATLAAGPEARLSDWSAASFWRLRTGLSSLPVHVTVPGTGGPRRRTNLIVHRRRTDDQTRTHLGIAVASPAITIIDLAPHLSLDDIDAMVAEADKQDLATPESLVALAASCPDRPGAAKVRRALERHTFVLTDSHLERLFVPLSVQAGLGVPLTQTYLNSHRVDFVYPDLRLVVETDGLRYHRTPSQQSKDLRRDQDHAAAGQERLRFSHWQVKFEAGRVVEVLEAVGARLRGDRRRAA
jgi:very-short-patch-repair endonuclease